jgi:DNA-binding winged helix-turn-helix (wHTH) protein
MIYAFGEYELDTACYELRCLGKRLPIEPKAFDLLAYLVQQRGRAVSKDELLEHVWPQQFVSEGALLYCIKAVLKSIGDSGRDQRLIKTIHGRGYRFIAPVEEYLRQSPPEDTVEIVRPQCRSDNIPASVTQSAPNATRRQLTILYCHVLLSPVHTGRVDPVELGDIRQEAHDVCANVIRRFDGYVAQSLGDGLMVYFGYPYTHEDDAPRAVRTGLKIVQELGALATSLEQEASIQLAVQVGIHTGSMVIGVRGDSLQRESPFLGEAPTIAAQLHSLAAANTVAISQATCKLVEGYFVCQPLGVFVLEEPSQPLTVYRVQQEIVTHSRFEVARAKGLTPLVGRLQETEFLLERWEQVKEARGQVVLLSGEAGIGKSRLLQVLKERLADEPYVHLESRGSPYYRHSTLQPVIESLQRVMPWLQDEAPQEKLARIAAALQPHGLALQETVPLVGQYVPLAPTPQRHKHKTFETIVSWLLQEAERQPMCFVVEDLHWVDASTLELLGLLLEQLASTRILALLTFRPDFRVPWAMRSHFTYLPLGRLSHQQTVMLMQRVAGDKPLPPEVVRQIVAKTDGVPLFIEELTRMVLESGLVKERHGQYELAGPLPPLAIPTTLQDSLMARLDRLGTAKHVAQIGAILGREFPYTWLQAVAPMDAATLQQALTQLMDAELLLQRGLPPQVRYSFTHALIQEAAYVSLLRSTRRRYHKRIAQMLATKFSDASEAHPELIAYHYTQAGLQSEAIVYWQQAGQRALARSAPVEAISHVSKGLEALAALPEAPERRQQGLRLQLALGMAMSATRGYAAPEVGQIYNQAQALCQLSGGPGSGTAGGTSL